MARLPLASTEYPLVRRKEVDHCTSNPYERDEPALMCTIFSQSRLRYEREVIRFADVADYEGYFMVRAS